MDTFVHISEAIFFLTSAIFTDRQTETFQLILKCSRNDTIAIYQPIPLKVLPVNRQQYQKQGKKDAQEFSDAARATADRPRKKVSLKSRKYGFTFKSSNWVWRPDDPGTSGPHDLKVQRHPRSKPTTFFTITGSWPLCLRVPGDSDQDVSELLSDMELLAQQYLHFWGIPVGGPGYL